MGRQVVLRGFRLHKCPYWVRPSITISDYSGVVFSSKKHPRTKDMMPEDIWFNAPRKGIMVFALPGERGLADLSGDFKVLFHDRHGDFYCWLNTNMMENRTILGPDDLDGFDKRRLPSPGFQVEIVILDHDIALNSRINNESPPNAVPLSQNDPGTRTSENAISTVGRKERGSEKDDVFSDTESEGSTRKHGDGKKQGVPIQAELPQIAKDEHKPSASRPEAVDGGMRTSSKDIKDATSHQVKGEGADQTTAPTYQPTPSSEQNVSQTSTHNPTSDFKAMAAASAADASVFTFGDEEDYESEED